MKALVYYKTSETVGATGAVCDSAVTRARDPFFVPDSRPWRRMTLRGVRIDRLGKGIRAEYASRYYSECLTAVHPFTPDDEDTASAWCRDGALIVSETVRADNMSEADRQLIDRLIAVFSYNMTLKTGDLILFASDSEPFPAIEQRSYDIEIESRGAFPPMKLKIR